jgi:hypothetical protein
MPDYIFFKNGDVFYFGLIFIVMEIDKIKEIENRIGYTFVEE